jgi:hypothetical protein
VKQIFLVCIFTISTQAYGQNETAFFNALKNVETATIESYLEDNIDFCLFEDQQIMSKKVALAKLKSFLNNQKILSVEVIHQGTSKDKSSQYKVAKITTSRDVFRLFVYASGQIGPKTIKELRVDKF